MRTSDSSSSESIPSGSLGSTQSSAVALDQDSQFVVEQYGLRFGSRRHLSASADHVEVSIEPHEVPAPGLEMIFGPERVAISSSEGAIVVDRGSPHRVRLSSRYPLTLESLRHPHLSIPAAVVCQWNGRHALHGGAFDVGTSCVVILADKEGGKSTTMATAARLGYGIRTDDLVVIDGHDVMAGPPLIDLRVDAASHFATRALGLVGARDRWRLDTAPVSQWRPVAAIAQISWGDTISVERVGIPAKISMLQAADGLGAGLIDPSKLLALLDVPAFAVRRPRDLSRIDEFVEVLASLAEGAS